MQVKFDKLNRYEVPNFTLCNPGSVYRDGALTKVVGPICNTSDEEIEFNFNSTSTLSFRVCKLKNDDTPEVTFVNKIYADIMNRRLIFVDDIGYFIITDVDEGYENGIAYKDVTASSCEIEIQNKGLIYIQDDTYKFTDLITKIVSVLPKWTIDLNSIPESVAERYRTFEDVDTSLNTFAFLMEEVQEAYECIFTYDTIHRIISVYDKNNYVIRTDIHLTRDDLITKLNITENSDDLYTALSVFGSDDLTISSVNPLGTTTIYNFDCYLDWMSEGLRDKVSKWEREIAESEDKYCELDLAYCGELAGYNSCQNEIDRLTILLELYQQCKDNVVAESSGSKVSEYNDAITSNNGTAIEIADVEVMLASIVEQIGNTETSIREQSDKLVAIKAVMDDLELQKTSISDSVAIEKVFTEEEYDELYDFIYEGIYTDDYIITTDTMDEQKKSEQRKELYNRAKRSLQLAAFPVQEFTVDVEDFVFMKEFERWSYQLETGSLINVELVNGDIAELLLVTITLNWEDRALSLTFGNRFNRFDPQALFNNVLGNIQKSSNSINYIKEIIYPVKGGVLTELENGIQNVRVLSVNDSITSKNGEVILNSTGYTGRKQINGDTYESQQVKIVGNTIVYTNDAWQNKKTLLGYVKVPGMNPSTAWKYGVDGSSVIGTITIGDQLVIKDKHGIDPFVKLENAFDATTKDIENYKNSINEAVEQIDGDVGVLRDEIGTVPSGSTVIDMIDSAVKNNAATNKAVEANAAAIAELRALIEELSS